MSRLRTSSRVKNPLDEVVSQLKQNIASQGGNFCTRETTHDLIGLESLNDDRQTVLGGVADQMIHSLESVFSNIDFGDAADSKKNVIPAASLEAGAVVAMAYGDLVAYSESAYRSVAKPEHGVRIVDSITAGIAPPDWQNGMDVAFEAFDERPLKDFLPYSIAFNIYASRQDEFSEMFYPTTVVTPDQGGIDITVGRMTVMSQANHSITGAPAAFVRRNLLDAVVDHTILGDESTRVYPVVSSSPDNTANFVAPAVVAPYAMVQSGATFNTAPLIMGRRMDLLGLGQVAALMGNGILNYTDSLDARVSLEAIYMAFPPAGSPAVQAPAVRFRTGALARNTFSKTNEGNYRELGLQFMTNGLVLNANTRAVDGTVVSQFAGIVAGPYTVFLQVNVDGRVNTEVGDINVYASPVTVYAIVDSTGASLSLAGGAGAAIVGNLAGMTIVGYDVRAYRTNSNRRTRGLLLDTTYQTERYTIPLGSPISAASPITSSRDAVDLRSLITAARIRNSNNAVSALFNYADTLYSYITGPASPFDQDWNPYDSGITGMGKYVVHPFYEQHTIDMALAINSIQSNDKADDISATLVNCIRDVVYRMYQKSHYQAALDAFSGNPNLKPILLVGTDQVIARHLMVAGDTRTFGQVFDSYKLAVSQDSRMYNKIVLSFARPDAQGPDPLTFGCHAWVPELTSSIVINRDGATFKEAMVQPRTLHINSLPIMAILTIVNLSEVLSESIVFPMDTVAGGTGTLTGSVIAPGTGFPSGSPTGDAGGAP